MLRYKPVHTWELGPFYSFFFIIHFMSHVNIYSSVLCRCLVVFIGQFGLLWHPVNSQYLGSLGLSVYQVEKLLSATFWRLSDIYLYVCVYFLKEVLFIHVCVCLCVCVEIRGHFMRIGSLFTMWDPGMELCKT